MSLTLPFLERDLAASKRRKSELSVVTRRPEELVAALAMLREVMEEAELYGATFDLQERYASLRRWMLRCPDEIVRLLVEQRAHAVQLMIAVSRLNPASPQDILSLVRASQLADSVRRHPYIWRRLLDECLHEARIVRRASRTV